MTTETVERKSAPSVDYETSLTIQSALVFLLAVVLGLVAAGVVLPRFVPGIASSFTGTAPKGYWYLSRGSAFVAMGLLWVSMMLGVGITNKMAHVWPGAPAAFAIHEYVSLLGLAFAGFHALILLGDQYSKYQLVQLLTPFGSVQYRPTWVAFGQLGFYIWALLSATFYVRKQIGQKTWRVIHYVSFLCYLGAQVHGILSGTDTGLKWAQGFYWVTGASFLFLLVYRILTRRKAAGATKPVRNTAGQ